MGHSAFYTIGGGHRVCEDYARAGKVSGRVGDYALVSDGCSSSQDTDLGARLLVLAAEHRLQHFKGDFDSAWVIRRAAAALDMLGAPRASLDATLLSAFVLDGDTVQLCVAGDGAVAARRSDGALVTWEICDGGAPGYLSYLLEPARLKRYLESSYGMRRVVMRVDGVEQERQEHALQASDFVLQWTLDAARYESITLLSDGVSSFDSVGSSEVIDALCAYKSYTGDFVQRRCKRFLGRECRSRAWKHHDDIAVAAITLQAGQA